MSKSKIVMVCPNGHIPVLDEGKSTENWQVFIDPCPECGEKLKMEIIND